MAAQRLDTALGYINKLSEHDADNSELPNLTKKITELQQRKKAEDRARQEQLITGYKETAKRFGKVMLWGISALVILILIGGSSYFGAKYLSNRSVSGGSSEISAIDNQEYTSVTTEAQLANSTEREMGALSPSIEEIMRTEDVEELSTASVEYPILLPTQAPAGAECATVSVTKKRYSLTFYRHSCTEYKAEGRLTSGSNEIPGVEVVCRVAGELVGSQQCKKDVAPNESYLPGTYEITKVGSKEAIIVQGADGENLVWCDGDVEYLLFRYPEPTETAENLQAINSL